jgi:hypothetical protein
VHVADGVLAAVRKHICVRLSFVCAARILQCKISVPQGGVTVFEPFACRLARQKRVAHCLPHRGDCCPLLHQQQMIRSRGMLMVVGFVLHVFAGCLP